MVIFMRIYAYFRSEGDSVEDSECFLSRLSKIGYEISHNRLIKEEVTADIPIIYRDKIINLVNYALEENNVLIINGIDSLGSNFTEIKEFYTYIDSKKIFLICLNFSTNLIKDDLKKIFIHFLQMGEDFESNFRKKTTGKVKSTKKVGRPEILNYDQKNDVLQKFKKGKSVYSLAKEYNVTRTVIQRILNIELEKGLEIKKNI